MAWNSKPKIKIFCRECKKEFETFLCLINIRKYCSRKCEYKSRKNRWKTIKHPFLGKRHSKESIEKMKKAHKVIRKELTLDNKGYYRIHKSEHPFAQKSGYIRRSRLVMEKHLGRYLSLQEIVHHINHIKTDDKIENLQLCSTNKEHRYLHRKP